MYGSVSCAELCRIAVLSKSVTICGLEFRLEVVFCGEVGVYSGMEFGEEIKVCMEVEFCVEADRYLFLRK